MDESSATSSDEVASAELPPAPHRPIREDRAARVFLLLGFIGAFVVFVGLAAAAEVSTLERLVRLIPEVLWVIALFAATAGLGARRPWALAPLTLLLLVLFIGGAVSVAQSLAVGRFFVPFGALLVIWAFRAPAAVPNPPSGGLRSVALLSAFVLASVGPWLADAALAPGGPLSVGASDVVPVLSLDCGGPGQGVPKTVTGTVDWSWRRVEALTDGTDMVAVGWSGQDDAGNTLFILGDTAGSTDQPGIWHGGGSPSQALSDAFTNRFAGFSSWTWGVTLAEQRMNDGHVPFAMLRVSGDPVAHGEVTVQAAYVHLGKWINQDAKATCTW